MADRFMVSITHADDDGDKATVGFVVANAAVASGSETLVFLSTNGVYLAEKGRAETIHEEGFAPLKDLMDQFVEEGGKIYVCSPCFKKRHLDETALVEGATIVGGAKLVEFMKPGASSITY
ncbi:DsrE family protein [Sulfobacillus harzensis]|uniref:Sulfur reduction protein DsrE n=1 Tax=Sulfobacillus harzensis TaxID=2729629 RepID=A0A7Y0L6F6_9FIRM|nr:DsrE family protein [Sulfobacillus harzensis]NMP22794.1 sulfur reduction protein DsrE [Sulfobacillus harzensis]